MAGAVSVLGAQGEYQTLLYGRNVSLAQQLAASINQRVTNGELKPLTDNTAPTLPGGERGEFVQTQDGTFTLPRGYAAVVDNAANATLDGAFGRHASVMAGAGNLDFQASSGAGTVVGGNGNDTVSLDPDAGKWRISLGDGNDEVKAAGSDINISLGTGTDTIVLGSGKAEVNVAGAATVFAGSGAASIHGDGNLTFVGGAGNAAVQGGRGADNLFMAGGGNETLIGGQTAQGGQDQFEFTQGMVANVTIKNFGGTDQVLLKDFGQGDVSKILATEKVGPHGVTVTLPDNTKVTFVGIKDLDARSFQVILPPNP